MSLTLRDNLDVSTKEKVLPHIHMKYGGSITNCFKVLADVKGGPSDLGTKILQKY